MTSVAVGAQGRDYLFAPGAEISIGQSWPADVLVHGPAVADRHARLVAEGGTWYLVDNDSPAGTWVDGRRVTRVAITGPLTARLGEAGGAEITLSPASEAAAPPGWPTHASPLTAVAPQATVSDTQATVRDSAVPPDTGPLAPVRPVTGPLPAVPPVTGPLPAVPPVTGPLSAVTGPVPPVTDPLPAWGPMTGPLPPGSPPAGLPAGPPSWPGAAPPGYGPGAPHPAPVLVTRLGREQRIFPAGATVRVGRDPSLELVSLNPLVSRQVHGVIQSDAQGATYTDRSRRGTFLDGKPLTRPLRITQSVVLRLGDPATGEELGITPPLSSTQLARNRGRRLLAGRLRIGVAAAAAVVVVAGLAAGVIALTRGPAPAARAGATLSNGLPVAVLHKAETATVRLLIGSRASYTGWGSGTVISPGGLILTNAHVAEPEAPGLAVAAGAPVRNLGPDPAYLTVELTTGQSSAVIARYRARPVAVDGYLDLAVVQIYATSSGRPVKPGSLRLPYLQVGNVSRVDLDQPVTVLGFPGVAQSDSITVTSGVVSTFVPDPLGHVSSPRFELETTARVAHGNSGGAAINNAGQLIGVPSLAIPGEGGDVSWRLRSVAQARPLIAAARAHAAYHSKILVQLTGAEQVSPAGVGVSPQAACSASPASPPAGSAFFGVSYRHFAKGLDIALAIDLPDGTAVTAADGGLLQSTARTTSGCFAFQVNASALGMATLPEGTYQVQLLGGPDLTPLASPTGVLVGQFRGSGAQPGSPPAPGGSPSDSASGRTSSTHAHSAGRPRT